MRQRPLQKRAEGEKTEMGVMNASANNYAQSNVKALNVLIEKQWSVMAEESSEKYLDVS